MITGRAALIAVAGSLVLVANPSRAQAPAAGASTAVQLVHSYVPPDPELLQKCKDSGKLAFEVVQPGRLGRIVCRDCRLPGDSLAITLSRPRRSP